MTTFDNIYKLSKHLKSVIMQQSSPIETVGEVGMTRMMIEHLNNFKGTLNQLMKVEMTLDNDM